LGNEKEIQQRANWLLTLCEIPTAPELRFNTAEGYPFEKNKKNPKIIGITWIIDHAFSKKGKWQ